MKVASVVLFAVRRKGSRKTVLPNRSRLTVPRGSSIMAARFFRSVLLFGLLCSSSIAWSQTLVPRPDPKFQRGTERPVRRWAVIIGVESYSREPKIQFAVNDARLIETALVTSGDFAKDDVLVLSDNQPQAFQPTLDNLQLQIPRWLGNAKADDVVFVYFSGHGDMDSAGRGLLCPNDYDRADSQRTGLSLTALRTMLLSCAARQKVLVLDCCHAGANKAVGVRARVSNQFLAPFQAARGLVTLASCRANELSYEDERQRQGVFTSHVAQALRGGADSNRDGVVDSEELFEWCSYRVPALVQKRFNADQHPERLRHPDEVFGISRTQFAPSVDHLVARKEHGVFRVESLSDQNWTVRGSAFAIAFVQGKLYLVTSASVLEGDEGRLRPNERYRMQGSRLLSLALWMQPTRILFHPLRKNGSGPDVAIVEVSWPATVPPPVMFNLRSPDETTDLRGRECAFLAFPNRQDINSYGPPEYASGLIAADYDAKQSRFSYRADYPNQADGAPLFVIDDQSERGGQLRESVVGITSSSRYGDNQRQAESVDLIWQIIFNATPELGFPILPHRKSRSDLKETGLSVRVPPESPSTQEQAPPQVNWQERIDRALKLAAQEGRSRNWDRGVAHLGDIEAQLAQEGLTVILPWEFYTLRGVLITHRGLQQSENGNRSDAIRSFTAAWKDCHHGWEMAPDDLFAQLMVGRIYNNLGTPNPGQAVGAKELVYLKWTHDRMKTLVAEDQKGIRKLEPQHLAQCQYLLGYVHQIAGNQICSTASGRENFEKSWAVMPTKQVARMLQIQSLNSVDIWNEYDELLLVWDRRRSTACKSCQVAKKCETCN